MSLARFLTRLTNYSDLAAALVLARVGLLRQFRQWHLWWLLVVLGQVFFAGVVLFAFSRFLPRLSGLGGSLEYGVAVYAGIVVWAMFQDSASQAMNLFDEYRSYLLKFRLPLWPYAVGIVGLRVAVYSAGVGILAVIQSLALGGPSARLWLLLPLTPSIVAGGFGAALLVAIGSTLARHLRSLIPHLLFLLFFATPIVYRRDALPPGLRGISGLNPLTHVVECFQSIWLPATGASATSWLVALATPMLLLAAALLCAHLYKSRILDLV